MFLLTVPSVGLQCVIVVFPDHTHLLFVGWYFLHLFKFNRTFCMQINGDPDQASRSAATGLSLHCLPLSHKNEVRLIWVKTSISL